MSETRRILTRRAIGCFAAAIVFALMWGPQEGTQSNYAYAIRKSLFGPRIAVFLVMGVLAFLAITYWPSVKPYLTRPGAWPLAAGIATVIAAQTLLHWYDPVGDAKFGAVRGAVANTSGLNPLTTAFFGWLAWVQLLVVLAVVGWAVATRRRRVAWVGVGLSLVAAAVSYVAHAALVSFTAGIDHSLGAAVAVLGYLVVAVAGSTVALTDQEVARSRDFLDRALGWRPGLPLVVVGLLTTLIAFARATWFSPSNFNSTLGDTSTRFTGSGLASIAGAYLLWLGWALLAVTAVVAGAAAYLRHRTLGWLGAGLGFIAVLLTLITVYDISSVAAAAHVDSATGPWQNLGAGGWMACIGLFLIGAGGFLAATSHRAAPALPDALVLASAGAPAGAAPDGNPAAAMAGGTSAAAAQGGAGGAGGATSLGTEGTSPDAGNHGDPGVPPSSSGGRMGAGSGTVRTFALVGVALALFYPPTTTLFWQKVLVGEIGVFVLLAVGLNVVVGWAGLLDLGFIAFYAIGSYTTAYLVGSLPIKPPDWLHMSPLLAIPFAIAICLAAGVALGFPTLRLRGDYLAIVTLGFGEIIRIVAINADAVTNSTRGPSPPVPNPVIHLGPLKVSWGLNQLQYWYLLLVLIIIVVVLFYRLEGSRLGRAWAAIREDEVAAQATGVNTARVKLMAFAIGASTSGVAGVFFASQVGYFNPDNFVLNNSILVVAYVVFGGMGSLPGAMAGAAVLTWLPEFLRDQVPAEDRQMWIGAVVLLMMIFRPAGLLPANRRRAELSGLGAPLSAETSAVARGGAM